MDKKYELIETSPGWLRVKALKDFTLITGEQIKKGDTGGLVESEDCLSQEGSCWVKDSAIVYDETFCFKGIFLAFLYNQIIRKGR